MLTVRQPLTVITVPKFLEVKRMSSTTDHPRVYHGAYGLCRNPSGYLLLVRLADGVDKGRWTLPGGGVEWGEHPDGAVLRELEEETGITDIQSAQVTAIFSHTYLRSEDQPNQRQARCR